MDVLQHELSEKSGRTSKALARLLAAMLAVCISLVPVGAAFADSTLELPQTAAPTTPPDASYDTVAAPKPDREAMAPLPKDLGTLQDYERETEADPSSGQSQGFASPPMNQRYEANLNRPTMAQNAILGALVLGIFAMQLHAAHQHRHQ